ncbi:alpha/beta fold hydrolase [Natronococcus roseus]|uniref:alpha/beta fold hydrolase n=1 Tax=Natronococcus roseus TaxID=1052014 RepID=UPI00374C95C9
MANVSPTDSGELETVTSSDGTEIAYERTGSGPPIVLVHGAVSDRTIWEFGDVRSSVADRRTVYAMDRRGHGGSEATEPYALEQGVDDVIAVVEAVDDPVALLGHSSGGLYALEAAARTDDVERLLLYEPAVAVTDDALDVESEFEAMMSLLEDGRDEEALVLFLEDIARISSDEIDALRSEPTWEEQVELVHTVPLGLGAVSAYEFDPDRYADLETPTLLLTGDESAEWFGDGIDALEAALPNARVATMAGHGHVAQATGPERFVDEVLGFLEDAG